MKLDPEKHYLFGLVATDGTYWYSVWRTRGHPDVIRGPFDSETEALLDLSDTSEMLLEHYDDMDLELGEGPWDQPDTLKGGEEAA